MEYLKKNQTKKSEMITKANEEVSEKKNSDVNLVTEIKKENTPFGSTFIATEHNHVQFENVLIKMEREDQFFEENETLDKPLVNQDEIISFVTQNDAQLTTCAIKKENVNQDLEDHLYEKFDNILEKYDSENNDMEIKVEKNYDYSLCSEKCTNDLSTNLDEIKIDIVNNDIESVNCETYIQYKSENIKEFSKEHITPMENKDKTKKDTSSWFTAMKKASTSKSSKLQDIDNRKVIPAKIQQYECNVSKKQYTGSTNLRKYMKIHTKEKSHECSVCQKKFSQLSNLGEHMRIHTGEKPYECDICQKKFTHSSSLMCHKRIHTGEKPYACHLCQKKFTLSASLMNHKRIHTGEKPHECDVCQKKFNQISNLMYHKKIHTREKPHACDVCQKKFTHSTSLIRHKRIHTGEKPHTCNVCQKKFTHSSSLMYHKRIHTGEKPHACDVCQKTFNQSSSLMRHMRIHIEKKTHVCDVCQKKFDQSISLKNHKRIHTR